MLKLKIFTLRFLEPANGFDDSPLQEFTADKEIIEHTEHFFIHDGVPYLTVVLSYRGATPDGRKRSQSRRDPRTELDAHEREGYDALRTWRAAKAKQEGIPPYMIANNKQLARMVKLKAGAKADLAMVNGIGDAKIEQHGEEILRKAPGSNLHILQTCPFSVARRLRERSCKVEKSGLGGLPEGSKAVAGRASLNGGSCPGLIVKTHVELCTFKTRGQGMF